MTRARTRADAVEAAARAPIATAQAPISGARAVTTGAQATTPGAEAPSAEASALHERWTRHVGGRAARACLAFLCAAFLASVFAPLLPLRSPVAMSLAGEARAPEWPWVRFGEGGYAPDTWSLSAIDRGLARARGALFGDWQTAHWLGTDSKGRDLLARIVWGSRTSMIAALMAAATSLAIGVSYGAIAGFAGGRVDNAMMRLVDVLYAIPFVFLVIFVITMLNEYQAELTRRFGIHREVAFYVLIGAVYWLTMARVVRGQVLALREAPFVQAARVLGASTPRILAAHVLPNVLPVVIAYLTLTLPSVMLFEAFLSFLGLGVEAPRVSFGVLAADGAEAIHPLRFDWWLVVFPSLALGTVLLSLNVLGDGMRDALDPRERGRA